MDKKRIFLNVGVSICSRILLLFVALLVRKMLIQYIGNDVNGLNSLYTNIIGMLAIAELGVGSAIVYSMYSPIVNGYKQKIVALYCLYRRLYQIIGFLIFGMGLIVMLFLPRLIDDYESISVDVYSSFFLSLLSVTISYFYSAKTSLIEAYRDNYITSIILTISRLVCYGLQIVTIILWQSYYVYLICQIIETLIVWGLTEIVVRRMHADIVCGKESLDLCTKKEVSKNIKAVFMHKIGGVLVDTTDSVIISIHVGVATLGLYTNYHFLAVVLAGTISLFFTPLTSIVGHLCAKDDTYEISVWFEHFYCLNYIVGFVSFLGYYAVIDNIVALCFGSDLAVSRLIIFTLTLCQFSAFMRKSCLIFKDASGLFYNDRYKPLVEGVINLILSLTLVNVLPKEFCIIGVILSTIVTSLLICHTVEPYVVFYNLFGKPPLKYCLRNYFYFGLFFVTTAIFSLLIQYRGSEFKTLVINGSLSLAVSVLVFVLLAIADPKFRIEAKFLLHNLVRIILKFCKRSIMTS